jgi:hypothetical protein
MYWYTWAILAGIVGAVTLMGMLGSLVPARGRGWKALRERFPATRMPEPGAFTGRSTMHVFAPGETPTRYGCLAMFTPWAWKLPLSVRFASDAHALTITIDEGLASSKDSVQIPFDQLRLLGVDDVKLAYTAGGRYGQLASLQAGPCVLVVPAAQFDAELNLLREFGQVGPDPHAAGIPQDPAIPSMPSPASGDPEQPGPAGLGGVDGSDPHHPWWSRKNRDPSTRPTTWDDIRGGR